MDEEIRLHRFDKKNTDFQSEEIGRIIRSTRKFGIEIEMVSKTAQSILSLAKSVSKAFGFDHDGSIQAGRGNTGIEVVSPIMSGLAGENGIIDLFQKIKSLDFDVNASCGLHVHLDGTGFKPQNDDKIITLDQARVSLLNDLTRKDFIFLVKSQLLNEIRRAMSCDHSAAARLLLDEYRATTNDSRYLYLSKTIGRRVPDIQVRKGNITLGKQLIQVDYYDYLQLVDPPKKKITVKVSDFDPKPGDYLCLIKNDNALENTKTLLYVYCVFNDVFMAMLPKSRRNNVYCQSLALSFSPNQIEALRSMTELETAWYKTRDMMETASHKGNNYDDSRYYGVNLHSLFAKYGTVEIRSHSATLDYNKVLYWVALHQAILDKITNSGLSINSLKPGAYLTNVEEKAEFLMQTLSLRTSLRKYMRKRIEYFNSNIK